METAIQTHGPAAAPRPSHRVHARRVPRAWPRRVGILNDYVRIPYANGSSFASQFLYREFAKRGHDVTVIGPDDPQAQPGELPPNHVLFPAVPLRNHPGVRLPIPGPMALNEVVKRDLDIMLAQSCSELVDLGVWLRAKHDVPFLCVNTVHMPSAYNVLLPDALLGFKPVNSFFEERLIPWIERHSGHLYNESDGLIVLCHGLKQYWRERGVTVPIHVIPRSVEPKIFDSKSGRDPFNPTFERGFRLLVVCRHTREKNITRLLRLFARWVAPQVPEATLTLVGDGPDHDTFKAQAEELGIAHRCDFPGEFSAKDIPTWYHHADLFVYPSLSETYGQVVTEAMWCGLPPVAFADNMGVSHQIDHGRDGILVEPGPDQVAADELFGRHTVSLLLRADRRAELGTAAARSARQRAEPVLCVRRYYDAFDAAREHCRATKGDRTNPGQVALKSLARWSSVQLGAGALGCIRPPAVVNRHGRKPPTWDLTDSP